MYSAEYSIFTEISFFSETVNSVTNNSYNILDINQNLTESMGSLPILNSKGTMRLDSNRKIPLEPEGAQGTPSPFSKMEQEPIRPTKPLAIEQLNNILQLHAVVM